MAIIRKVYGPFKFEEVPSQSEPKLKWYFFGIRGDGEMAHWVLVYDANTRTFRAANTGESSLIGRSRLALVAEGVDPGTPASVHPRMFIEGDDSLTQEGRVTDILKSKLSPEDIAKATAASITRR